MLVRAVPALNAHSDDDATALFLGAAILLVGANRPAAQSTDPLPLILENKIDLGKVSGRIDHMAFDPGRNRLFVAELGNNAVGVVDLNERKVVHVITGLSEPQGIGYASRWAHRSYCFHLSSAPPTFVGPEDKN
jgi:YVTN family beta-propeller protein